ncbi:MAG: hypothetical protein RHS_5367 [Robinsoniella sp. RHS]|uniref:glycoside hydrolase family 36 protein n=1 Tax=Robinsoniella TaxID=588605 RepID=UPI000488471B|nr:MULTISPECIES: glycoside hydrolase family 36 protein [Robinsoniella]KLU68802.1 MAG: hypothetical protein RHS_5367 [Robinsoniella sp. RHS]
MSYENCLKKIGASQLPPFTIQYGRNQLDNIDKEWKWKDEIAWQDSDRILHKRVYVSDDGLIRLTCEMTEFLNNNAVEWILYLENIGTCHSPVISNLLPLHMNLTVDPDIIPSVLYSKGCFPEAGVDNYALRNYPLKPGRKFQIDSPGGKTIESIPFFNICQNGRGWIGAVGWAGSWIISAEKTGADEIELKAGMNETNISLKPEEKIRTPRILLMPWEGEWIEAQNSLRRHNLIYHTPHYNGKPVEVPICHGGWGGLKEEHALELMDKIQAENMQYDAFWMDAGWYGPDREEDEYQVFGEEDWFLYTGDWRINKTAHPRGLKPISDAAHKHNMKYLLWFEPERVVVGTPISKEHPEWIIGDKATNFGGHKDLPYVRFGLYDFGNEEARKWMTDMISRTISEIGIDIFRQDCNDSGLAYYWNSVDTPDRRGMTQIRYVEGLLEFWDELRRRHPDLIFDIVQRGDLDTITRAVDLSRSDYPIAPDSDPIGNQIATEGLSFWRAHYGTLVTTIPEDTYHMRSAFCPGVGFAITDLNGTREQLGAFKEREFPFSWARSIMNQLRRARPYYYGDYYPLTISGLNQAKLFGGPWAYEENVCSFERTDWFAYQMNRKDLEEGMVMVLKRPFSAYCTAQFVLRGLEAEGMYEIEDVDTEERICKKGSELSETGLEITISEKPGSKLYFYRQMQEE